MRSNRKCKKGGFTFLEILMTIFLFSFGVVSIMGALGTVIFADNNAENYMVALNLLEEKAEQIQATAYAAVVSEDRATNETQLGTFGNVFDRDVVVTQLSSELIHVEIYVYWMVKGQETKVKSEFYKANYG